MFWYHNKKIFNHYQIVGNWKYTDFNIRFDVLIHRLLNSINSVGKSFLDLEIEEKYYPFIKFYLNQRLFSGDNTIQQHLENSFCDEGYELSFNVIVNSVSRSLKKYHNSSFYEKELYGFDLEKYDLRSVFDVGVLSITITKYILKIIDSEIQSRNYFRGLIRDGIKDKIRTKLGTDYPVLDLIYERYFIKGFEDDKLIKHKINKPTFQFKQQVKWGVITKSEYNHIMVRMYGFYFYSFLKGTVGIVDYPKQVEDYLLGSIDDEDNRELYYSLIFGMVNEKHFKGTFLYKNIKDDIKPHLYLEIYKLMKKGELNI